MSSFPALKKRINNGEIAGFCDPRFERVAQEFERNFQQRDERGASVCVTRVTGPPDTARFHIDLDPERLAEK